MYHLYILYSSSRDKYYVGSTGDELSQRLRRHNSNHKGFTGQASDWQIAYTETFTEKLPAQKRELEIKAWKSRKRVEHLIAQLD
jgi:putative endonuclease